MTIDDQLKQANLNFVRADAVIVNVIQSLEEELDRMRKRDVAQSFIDAKDQQIEKIVAYHNQCEELINFYKLVSLNLKIQLSEACSYIIKTTQNDSVQQQYLMQYIRTTNLNG